jgi:hypothetical protein
VFRQRLKGMGVGEVLTAPHSPWQNPFAERLIGSIRRECLNHVVVLGEYHLRHILARYFAYYHGARTHLALDKDAPHGRPIEPPELGRVTRFAKWVASTIATSDGRPDAAQLPNQFTTLGPLGSGRSAPTLGSFPPVVGPEVAAPKRLAVLPPTRYRTSSGAPWLAVRARDVFNRVG